MHPRPLLLAASLLGSVLCAPVAGAGSSKVALERALETIQADEIRTDLHFIASDVLRGRDTPSPGLQVAARFLVARLERLGFRPGAQEGFFHRYPLAYEALASEACALEVTTAGGTRRLRPGEGYWFGSPFDLGELEVGGRALWCGTGTQEELAGVELAGVWAVARAGLESQRNLRRRVQSAGAAGLLVIEDLDEEGRERSRAILARLEEGRVSWPRAESASGGAPAEEPGAGRRRERFPALVLESGAASALWPELAAGSGPPLGTPLAASVREERRLRGDGGVVVENVCAWWPGSDPELAREAILVSAHYDHVGARGEEIYNGADDNGSGTCGLLALAEALASYGPLRRSVLLIWVSGEEKGLYGSRAWSDAPWLPDGARAIANLNVDMIGRNAPDNLLVTPTRERGEDYNGLIRRVERFAPLEGFTRLGSADEYYDRSDQAMFARLGIPVAFLFADVHEDYHQPTDTADKIDYDKARRVVRLLLRVLDDLQADELDL